MTVVMLLSTFILYGVHDDDIPEISHIKYLCFGYSDPLQISWFFFGELT